MDNKYYIDELLVGYKETNAFNTEYIHCPYLPIIARKNKRSLKLYYSSKYGKTMNLIWWCRWWC